MGCLFGCKNDDGAYGIEGLYYDPDTNKFSSDDNKTDAKGNLIPMVFAESCNYISTHTVAELNGSVAVLYEEAVDGTHVSDVMYDQVNREIRCLCILRMSLRITKLNWL